MAAGSFWPRSKCFADIIQALRETSSGVTVGRSYRLRSDRSRSGSAFSNGVLSSFRSVSQNASLFKGDCCHCLDLHSQIAQLLCNILRFGPWSTGPVGLVNAALVHVFTFFNSRFTYNHFPEPQLVEASLPRRLR